ncbi:MAG: ethanolamine ammonia-lyase subunit EutC [Candidatus Binatia bacterium]
MPPLQKPDPELSALMQAVRARTPARILVGRAGAAYRTTTQLTLRQDHAAAIDAVRMELDLLRDFGQSFVERWGLFEVVTCANSKAEYLLRPDLGRHLHDTARTELIRRCPAGADLQVMIGDGLSAAAVVTQVPLLLGALEQGAQERGWRFGQPFVIRYCRVGILNDIGQLLDPVVAILLIGERPGLATAESLSAYLAYRPRAGHTDAERNLISNIHARGVVPAVAAARILRLAERLSHLQVSGVAVKEEWAGGGDTNRLASRNLV